MAQNSEDSLVRLRTRLVDLQKLGGLEPEAFGTYQQTLLQIYNEAERKKQACLQQAQTLRQQAAAAEAQSHAFGTIGSILYSVVNGYVELEQKRMAEEHEAKIDSEGKLPTHSASGVAYNEDSPPKPKKTPRKRGASKRS